ncbi:MAG: 50S ribosomal protein L32e [Candidatus Methanomethylicia archaeon]|jgi:large subunit ribosomal protein L32e|nr:50S ribosomal protein L32e [Candidatus Methanomethylicia archaeon]
MSGSDKLSRALKIREKISQRRPDFIRQEANRFPRLGEKWRSCTGIRSKMRLKKKGRAAIVESGYRSPVLARGLHPSGKREILVYNIEDLSKINPSTDVIRIASTVGKRKRLEILEKSKTLGVTVVNIRPSEKVLLEKREAPSEEVKEKETKGKAPEEERPQEPEVAEKEAMERKEEGWSAEREEKELEGSE